MRGKLSENFIPFVFASFVFMSLFGVGIGIEMKDGQMISCPFMVNQASICQMSIIDHIGKWQQAFLGVLEKSNNLILSLLLLAFAIVPFAKPFSQIKQTKVVACFVFYLRDIANKIFDPLLLAFSDSILNPKIYEPANI